MEDAYVIKGNLIYTPNPMEPTIFENGFLVVEKGKIKGCYSALPEIYQPLPLLSYEDLLVIPGLSDIHVHAPQYAYRGLGMDLELLEWLRQHAFPEEARYEEIDYAKAAYAQFVTALVNSATTRASVFATLHAPATLLLANMLEQAGMAGYVGKVNMDRNSPDILREKSVGEALLDTSDWLEKASLLRRVKPILTPRFVPSCSDLLMDGLGDLRRQYGVPVQSHLSENLAEIQWVKELSPQDGCYGDVYARHGLMEPESGTVMAHCVHCSPEEVALLKERRVMVAHCPASNTNLCSGVAPIRAYLEQGLRVGLGSDVAGGYDLSIFRAMTDAVQVSKLRFCFDPLKPRPLTLWEAFYLGTRGGGSFFGRVGSFEPGYEADAVVLDDREIVSPRRLSVKERMERAVYLEKQVKLTAKFVAGEAVALSGKA